MKNCAIIVCFCGAIAALGGGTGLLFGGETNASVAVQPQPQPTYLRDVMPIFIGKCFRCHNNQSFLDNWLDYEKAVGHRWEIKRRVWDSWQGQYFKQPMPTGNSPESLALTEEERALIKRWVETGVAYGIKPPETAHNTKAERIDFGKGLFTTICAACHQPSGQGIPSRFPPLAGSDFLNSDKHRAIQVVLNGLQGEVVVNGQRFNNSMPSLPLGDDDIACALTYVYNSFGNSGKEVTPEEVKALRGLKGPAGASGTSTAGVNVSREVSPFE
jgi:mono/diheme cytochrome c family protein